MRIILSSTFLKTSQQCSGYDWSYYPYYKPVLKQLYWTDPLNNWDLHDKAKELEIDFKAYMTKC